MTQRRLVGRPHFDGDVLLAIAAQQLLDMHRLVVIGRLAVQRAIDENDETAGRLLPGIVGTRRLLLLEPFRPGGLELLQSSCRRPIRYGRAWFSLLSSSFRLYRPGNHLSSIGEL